MTEAQRRKDFYHGVKAGDRVEYIKNKGAAPVVKTVDAVINHNRITFTDGVLYVSTNPNRIRPVGGW